MNKIALINVFVGELPWYFDYFVKSCSYNPTVDFYIFCNKSYTEKIPDNIKFIDFDLEKFNELASSTLKLDISIKSPYKLCDFKPAYGVIFAKYLTEYDFWGFCDVDVIFGQIREFMTDALFTDYDVISVRPDFPTGYFMLFRNEKNINYLFTQSKDYQFVFTSQKHYCFDECNFKHYEVSMGQGILEIPCEIETMHHLLVKEAHRINVHWDFLVVEGHPGHMIWNNGQLLYEKKYEALLYHLKFFKSNVYVRKKSVNQITNKFSIHGYHIQNNKVTLPQKFLDFFYYEILNPVFKRLIVQINYYISLAIFKNYKLDSTNECIFTDDEKFIKKNGEKYISYAFNKEFKNSRLIIPSYFSKSLFYVKGKSDIQYKISSLSLDLLDLQVINRIGNTETFRLKRRMKM